MNFAVGFALAIGLLTVGSPAQSASALSCAERLAASGVNPSRLSPGDRGRLDGYEFIVAKSDSSAVKICARVDAQRTKEASLRSQLTNLNVALSQAQGKVEELRGGGPIKQNYLVVEGSLLAWAVIASIWASYFAGRLGSRRRQSF
jgi:hypothetical protein